MRSRLTTVLSVILATCLLGLGLIAGSPAPVAAAGASIIVTDPGQAVDGADGRCTLAEAIIAANTNRPSGAAAGECAAGTTSTDTIRLNQDGSWQDTALAHLDGPTALPVVTSRIVIQGVVDPWLTGIGCGADNLRLFAVGHGGALELRDLMLLNCRLLDIVYDGGAVYLTSNGSLTATNVLFIYNLARRGGAIANVGTGAVVVTGSAFTQNIASQAGGAIATDGRLTVTGSSISGNSAGLNGAGIFLGASGALTLTASLLSGNFSGEGYGSGAGGGLLSTSSLPSVVANSTIDYNAAGTGGGLAVAGKGQLTVINSTVTTNQAGVEGGGLARVGAGAGPIKLVNTIVAGNSTPEQGELHADCGATPVTSQGYNLTGAGTGCPINAAQRDRTVPAGEVFTTVLDQSGEPYGGGPVFDYWPLVTHALLGTAATNPAIDGGNSGVCASAPIGNKDQRGVSRPQGSRCDIGAYEKQG